MTHVTISTNLNVVNLLMIKITDLRIGNFLFFDKISSLVTAIDIDLDGVSKDLVADGSHRFIELSTGRIEGIRITEKILLDCGFKNVGKISDKMDKWAAGHSKFILYFNGEEAGLITSLPKSVPIIFCHQLQNLYFSITGEELKMKQEIHAERMN